MSYVVCPGVDDRDQMPVLVYRRLVDPQRKFGNEVGEKMIYVVLLS